MIIGIKIFSWEKAVNFETEIAELKIGDIVIVKTEFGVEAGKIACFPKNIKENSDEIQKDSIIRKATERDLEEIDRYKTKQIEAIKFAKEKIKNSGLEMKLAGAQFSFDGLILFLTEEYI
jgi:cell fate regulator YaaT (PSP1 superfamily)